MNLVGRVCAEWSPVLQNFASGLIVAARPSLGDVRGDQSLPDFAELSSYPYACFLHILNATAAAECRFGMHLIGMDLLTLIPSRDAFSSVTGTAHSKDA